MTPHPGEDVVFQGAPTLVQATRIGQLAYAGSLIWACLLEVGVIALAIAGRSVTEHEFVVISAMAYARCS